MDHTKSYVEKMHSVDAELVGHAHKIDMKLQSLCGNGFPLFAVDMLAKPYYLGVNWPTTLRENKDGVHSFTSIFDAIIGINKLLLCNSEMVILYDGIKTIHNEVFLISSKKEKKLFL